ncbi:MAG: benzoate membrane transport protein [Paracoccaceae bacterium]|jgi:benzoate membrane transport protein
MICDRSGGADPARRYWAAITLGVAYVALAMAAGAIATLAGLAPAVLITAVAGLVLISALVGSLSAAFADKSQTEAAALTFVIAASGMTLLGVSGAF